MTISRAWLLALVFGAVLFVALTAYGYFSLTSSHKAELLSTQESAKKETDRLMAILNEEINKAETLSDELAAEKARNGTFERTISGIKDTVDTLEKLKNTDPELLKKYSKVYFLNENYVPASLSVLPSEYVFPSDKELEVNSQILPFLERMLKAAERDGVELRIVSAYRSFGTQAALKSSYTVSYGSGANRFSADQGYSEHQLGTTLDLTTEELGTGFTAFDSTEAYTWLNEHADTYGFVLSYPKSNTYYQYEPWHWRFVGRALAQDLRDSGKNLYDLSEREIDAYLIKLFD